MIDWTVRDFRAFARLFCPDIVLYTEMIATSALMHGDTVRLLGFDAFEMPLVLQLGGGNPLELAKAAKVAWAHGLHALNLNAGCPSNRVQHYKMGACLMKEVGLVGQCMLAMADATGVMPSIKHRIGLDGVDDDAILHDFIGHLAHLGVHHFIVHARCAWLQGLSPKENRTIPPLKYDKVHRLKRAFPHLCIEINGGVDKVDAIEDQLKCVDGVMVGRAFYHDPYLMAQCNACFGRKVPSRREVFNRFIDFLDKTHGDINYAQKTRHYLGLFTHLKGARAWRRTLSARSHISLDEIRRAGDAILTQNDL